MNITTFREKVLTLNLNKAEKNRINHLTSRAFKYDVKRYTEFKEVTDDNFKQVWSKLNQQLAKEDKFNKAQIQSMRHAKEYVDYSDLAYNNSADDL